MFTALFSLALYYYLAQVVDQEDTRQARTSAQATSTTRRWGRAPMILQVGLSSFSHKINEEQTTGTFEALMAITGEPLADRARKRPVRAAPATIGALALIGLAVVVFGFASNWTRPRSGCSGPWPRRSGLGLFASLGWPWRRLSLWSSSANDGSPRNGGHRLALLGGVYFPVEVFPERSSDSRTRFRSPNWTCFVPPCSAATWIPLGSPHCLPGCAPVASRSLVGFGSVALRRPPDRDAGPVLSPVTKLAPVRRLHPANLRAA